MALWLKNIYFKYFVKFDLEKIKTRRLLKMPNQNTSKYSYEIGILLMLEISARPNSEGSRTVLRNILIFFGEQKFCFTLREVRTYGEHLRFIYKSAYLGDNY